MAKSKSAKVSKAKRIQKTKVKQAHEQVKAATVDDVKKRVMEELENPALQEDTAEKQDDILAVEAPILPVADDAKIEAETLDVTSDMKADLKTRTAPLAPQIKENDLIAAEVLKVKTPEQTQTPEHSTSPHKEGVVPPPSHGHGIWQDRALTAVLFVGVVTIIALLIFGRTVAPHGPTLVVQKLDEALRTGQVADVLDYVELPRVSASVVEQLQPHAMLDVSELPESLQKGLPQAVQDGKELDIQQGLAALFAEDAQAFAAGTPVEALPYGLFREVMERMGAAHPVRHVKMQTMIADENVAEGRVLVQRTDLDAPYPLDIRLENTEAGWKVVAVQKLQDTLTQIAALEAGSQNLDVMTADAESYKPLQIAGADASYVKVPQTVAQERVKKAFAIQRMAKAAASSRMVGDNLLVSVNMKNVSGKPIQAFEAAVVFTDADGRFIHSYTVADGIGVQKDGDLQKTWRIPVNLANRMEHHVYRLPMGAINMQLVPTRITFADGQVVVLG